MSNPTSLALRDNKGKPELSQVDPLLMEEVARVLEFGAKKYARNNWRKGQPVTKLLDSGMRHMAAILRGEDIDAESGCKHWAHVCCNMMFLGCQEGREELDDRYKRGGEETKTVIREQVGGGGGKVIDKKEGDDFLTRLRNSQRLQSMGVEVKKGGVLMFGQQGEEIESQNEAQEAGVGCDWISKDEEERREAIRKAMKAWEEEEEEEIGEEEESIHDDLDSQNPPSPPGTPPSYTDGERLYYQGIKPDNTTPPLKEEESTDKRVWELSGGNIASDEVNDCMMSKLVIGGAIPLPKQQQEEENKNQLDPDYVKKIVDRAQERKKFTQMIMEADARFQAEKAEEKRVLDMINRGEKYPDASETPYDDMFPEQVTYETDDESGGNT
jgi:hypothetical protein